VMKTEFLHNFIMAGIKKFLISDEKNFN